jgi:hypothetical protein
LLTQVSVAGLTCLQIPHFTQVPLVAFQLFSLSVVLSLLSISAWILNIVKVESKRAQEDKEGQHIIFTAELDH